MKQKAILMCAALLSLTACAQREYAVEDFYLSSNDRCITGNFDEVITSPRVEKSVLVKEQDVVNYYHVKEVKENHYYISRTPIYSYPRARSYVRGSYYVPRVRQYRPSYYIDNGYQNVPVVTHDNYSYSVVEQNNNMWNFFFQLNSDYITNKEELGHLINFAKSNVNTDFYIDSYADANTGTSDYNINISKRRAAAVYNVLLREGISKNRIYVKNHGSYNQEYNTNNLNRCVIVKAVYK